MDNMKKPIIITTLFLLLCSCQQEKNENRFYGDELDLSQVTPAEFLKYLADSCKSESTSLAHFYPISDSPKNWIKADDVKELEKYIYDKRPCRPVVSYSSSRLPTKNSTVGHEARYLIEGYYKGRYPHALVSTDWQPTDNR